MLDFWLRQENTGTALMSPIFSGGKSVTKVSGLHPAVLDKTLQFQPKLQQ